MAKGQYPFGHKGFEKRAEALMKKGKHDSFGENVAYLIT